MNNIKPILETQSLAVAAGGRILFGELTLSLPPGHCLGVLGPNGTGKTTLLHTLAGLLKPVSGNILLYGELLESWSRRALARKVGIVFQHHSDEMPATVMETALLGRFPHSRAWQWENTEDIDSATRALETMALLPLAGRQVATLSGGERQRLALAALLSQDPQVMLLDEPGNHLDIAYQVRVLQLLRQRAQSQGAVLVFATHDINLASRFCDTVLLISGDGDHIAGTCAEVLTEDRLSKTFNCDVRAINSEHGRFFLAV